MNRNGRPILVNLVLAAVSVLLTLLSLEAGIRVVMAFNRNTYDSLARSRPPQEGRYLALGDLLRVHEDDRIVYELKPGVRGRFLERTLSINSLGMRDVGRPLRKEEGVTRIAVLGDSHTFGWGVEAAEAYPARLEGLLEERFRGRRFEVMNLGVPGYNTVQEVRAFEVRVDALSPDMVIINYVNNDMDLPNFLAERPDLLTWNRSYLYELLKRRYEMLRGSTFLPAGLTRAPRHERRDLFRVPEDQIPERFRPLYGRERMVAAYRRLAGICRERVIPCLVLFNLDDYRFRLRGKSPTVLPHLVRELAAICRDEGFIVVDPQDRIARYLEENGLGTTAVWLTETDSHSNPLRHRFVAEEILETIEEEGLLAPAGGP